VGPGRSLEAAYDLKGDVPSGTFQVICDAIIIKPVDVTFDLIHRSGAQDTVLSTWQEHYEPLPGEEYAAQPFVYDRQADAIAFEAGDQLVFRFTGANATVDQAFIPNGDGALTDGRIPNITLPR
jgi:hypothetical protein